MEELPKVEIQPTQPITIHGVTKQLAPRILKCNKGGYLILLDDNVGIAACNEWRDVVHAINDVGRDAFNVQDEEPDPPAFLDPNRPPPPQAASEYSDLRRMVHVILAAIATVGVVLSVRMSI